MRRTIVAALALTALLPLQAIGASITVKPGDTLSDIAARYGISVGALMRMNGLRDADHVEVGQSLQVPGPRVVAGAGRHKVQSGDTLSAIAVRYQVSERALISLNNLPSADHVELGQTLKLPSNAVLPKPKPKPKPVAKAKPVPIKADPKASAHTVAKGQTLTQIAKAYQVPVASLISLNSIDNPDRVEVGTRLMLRGNSTSAPDSKPAATTEPVANDKPADNDKPAQSAKPVAKPVQTAKASTDTTSKQVQPKDADWRTYGPLQVDWANWQSMGGSEVAPTLNGDGKPLYVAVNCGAKKINVTGADGGWKTWSAPQTSFEEDLVKDRCSVKGG